MRRRLPPVTSLQPPYSLIKRDIEKDVLPYCQQQNIGVIAYSPMASGLLTGAMDSRARGKACRRMIGAKRTPSSRNRSSRRIYSSSSACAKSVNAMGTRPGQVAIAWTLRHLAVTGAIVGARNARQVEDIMSAVDFRLTEAEIAEVEGA